MKYNSKKRTLRLAQTAMLIALIAVLQYLATLFTQLTGWPISITLTMIPIVIGAVLFGPISGGILGLAFGVITVILGLTSIDPQIALLLPYAPGAMISMLLIKSTAAGVVAGLIAIPFKKREKLYPAVLMSAILAPLTNTSVYLFFALTFLKDGILQTAEDGVATSVIIAGIIILALANFIIELIIDVVLSHASVRIIQVVTKSKLV